jgi:hypothetical protein
MSDKTIVEWYRQIRSYLEEPDVENYNWVTLIEQNWPHIKIVIPKATSARHLEYWMSKYAFVADEALGGPGHWISAAETYFGRTGEDYGIVVTIGFSTIVDAVNVRLFFSPLEEQHIVSFGYDK